MHLHLARLFAWTIKFIIWIGTSWSVNAPKTHLQQISDYLTYFLRFSLASDYTSVTAPASPTQQNPSQQLNTDGGEEGSPNDAKKKQNIFFIFDVVILFMNN